MLDSEMLLSAYRHGIFPMAVDGRGEIGWFSPDPRALIPLDERFHIPHGVQRALKKKKFEITFDTEFDNVIRACATSHGKTWISEEIIQSYCELHRRGHAHSVESRLEGKLAGGLYGARIGGAGFEGRPFHSPWGGVSVGVLGPVRRVRPRGLTLRAY